MRRFGKFSSIVPVISLIIMEQFNGAVLTIPIFSSKTLYITKHIT